MPTLFDPITIGDIDGFGQKLEGDDLLELQVFSLVNLTHAAAAEKADKSGSAPPRIVPEANLAPSVDSVEWMDEWLKRDSF